MDSFGFHPVIEAWFDSRFAGPTDAQTSGWPAIVAGEHTLIAAPTGSGKTLAAFLACIDRLLKRSLAGELEEGVRVVYVSPLRALSNDMHRNLEVPLAEIEAQAVAMGYPPPGIRAGLRTGDTTASQRAALVRRPPQILVTTPESLYLMLTAARSRETLRNVETVIVDEIHAMVGNKRGSHLSLTVERLESLVGRPLQRIGLSATQKPIERTARFLVGAGTADAATASLPCRILDVGHTRTLDLAVELPRTELGAVCMHEQWAEIHERLVELINEHRTTLIFVNTRRLAERLTHQLAEKLGEGQIETHHGSVAADKRLLTERKLKTGELKAVVATASLELGIDIGYIDLVVQIGSPRSIATFLQRIGRSGHSLGLTPKGRLFTLTRDELGESLGLLRAVRSGLLDSVAIPQAPLDVLAQQIVAEAAAQDWNVDELFALIRRADPYRNLARSEFDRTIEYLSEGIAQSSGRGRVYLHHDHVGRRIKARKGARLAAIANAGAIPDIGSYRVIAEPDETVVGTLDEDFAVESMRGDVFLLGNTSWQILHVRGGEVHVADARGAAPTIPFWLGEAPGRTLELSGEVSRFREDLEPRLDDPPAAERWVVAETGCSEEAARQIVAYASAQKAAIGLLPTCRRIVFERFFDETGGMQLVVHAPFGGAVNRAWGFAMRKRFCRSFDFELQATADDDGYMLSMGPQHSFPIESLFPVVTAANLRELCEQAVLRIPMFQVRWRWNVTRALQVLRRRGAKKVPPALQRFRADDLLSAVFPRLTGCQEHSAGEIELPDHPLARQTMEDCLHEPLDIDGLTEILRAVERGEITYVARDTREPSPFAAELLNANPYAFLDGGEIQERRARAVSTPRVMSIEAVRDLGRLDTRAIEQVVRESQPFVRDADELHDLLLSRILLPVDEAREWQPFFDELAAGRRAAQIQLPDGRAAWVAAERLPAVRTFLPEAPIEPPIEAPQTVRHDWTSVDARIATVRGLLETCGPTTASQVARRLSITLGQAEATLEALEGEGVVLRGRFTPAESLPEAAAARAILGEHPLAPSPPTPLPRGERGERALASALLTITSGGVERESSTRGGVERESSPLSPGGRGAGGEGDQDRVPNSLPTEIEWCHRRLLARIHRLTIDGLRKQIEPVNVATYWRFLAGHHGLLPETRKSGANGLFDVITMLQGTDAPTVAWERDLLPARISAYQPQWLDELCLTGDVGWGRLYPTPLNLDRSRPMAAITRIAPISIYLRTDLDWLAAMRPPEISADQLSSPAQQVLELLTTQGAMFAADLARLTQMLPSQIEDVLGELVTRGLLTADGFGGLRQLVSQRKNSTRSATRHRRPGLLRKRMGGGAGRWSLWRPTTAVPDTPGEERTAHEHVVEQWAWQLLRRWGVIFRDLLVREAGVPRWYELLQVYRRLEARGEIRGGRFIAGVAGEQFGTADTVGQLRALRDKPAPRQLMMVSAADPLNLVGIVTPHPRVPSFASNRVAYLDGVPVAALKADEITWFSQPEVDQVEAICAAFGQRAGNPPGSILSDAIL
jgi:ATP-dependent helicase Lhr and Lhr-like helicase